MSTMSADLPPNGGLNGLNGHKQNGKKHLKPTAIVDNFSHLHIKTQTSGVTTDSQPGTTRRSNRSEPFFIGVAGGTASGKTTVCDSIMQRLHDQCAVMLSQDSFYRGLTDTELENVHSYDFDSPDAFDVNAMVRCLSDLKAMKAVEVPIYDFSSHQRARHTQHVEPADVVIIEGILVLHMPEVRKLLNMKIFVDTDDDVRLARRITRDVACRGRDIAGVLEQYTRFVKPSFDSFVAPSRRHADVIIPWIKEANIVAIDLITTHIQQKLQQPDLRRIYNNLEVIPSTYQIRGISTIIRDRETSKPDFCFYADRLLRLVVEAGLGHLPFTEKSVITPTGRTYVGVDFAKMLCGVSIIRSGESFENALRACCKGIKIGKILIHREVYREDRPEEECKAMGRRGSDPLEERELVYEKLPHDITERHVLLMDPVLATGRSADRAIEDGDCPRLGPTILAAQMNWQVKKQTQHPNRYDVLLGKGVDEGKILFLSLIAAPAGIHQLCAKYPRMKVVTSEIDHGLDEKTFQVVPGIGEFADRYYC